MIIKLIPAQIADMWDTIRYGIIKSIAPLVDPTAEALQNILCQLLKQDMQCWSVFDENKEVYGHIITSIFIEPNTNSRSLIIFSLYLFKHADKDMWEEGMTTLEEFGRLNDCSLISAYTADANVLSIAKKRGYMGNYTYVAKSIKEDN